MCAFGFTDFGFTAVFFKMAESATPKKTIRTCNMCRARMSGLEFDPHLICSVCRGQECTMADRCNECVEWVDSKMSAYVKHQKSLERKRKSKLKSKKSSLDVLCTGPGSDALSSGDGAADGGWGRRGFVGLK